MKPHISIVGAAVTAAIALLALRSDPVLAGPRSPDLAAVHAEKVRKLKEGPPSAVNDAYYSVAARQRAANGVRSAISEGGTLASDGSTNVNSVVLQPGARVFGDIVIVTEMRDLTVVNRRGPGP